jgi:hypothetical protein
MGRVDARRWALEQAELARAKRNRQRDINPFDGDADGTFESARPMIPSRGGFGAGSLGTVLLPPVQGGAAARHITAIEASQTFPAAGAAVLWDAKAADVEQIGYAVWTAGSPFVIEVAGTYGLTVEGVWSSWTGGGRVWVAVNGIRRGVEHRRPYGQRLDGETFHLGVLKVGDEVAVWVSPHGDPDVAAPADQTMIDLRVSLDIFEPIGVQTVDVPPVVSSVAGLTSTNQSAAAGVTAPPGTQAGDVLLFAYAGHSFLAGAGGDGTITPPAGVTVLHTAHGGLDPDRVVHQVAYAVATVADETQSTTYSWTNTRAPNNGHGPTVVALRGIGGFGTVVSSSGVGSAAKPRLVTVTGRSVLVAISALIDATSALPSGWALTGTSETLHNSGEAFYRTAGRRLFGVLEPGSGGIDWTASGNENAHAVTVVALEIV